MRDPSLGRKKPTPFLKVVLLLPWVLPSTTLGTILGANKLAPLPGSKVKSSLGMNDRVLDLTVDGEQRLEIK